MAAHFGSYHDEQRLNEYDAFYSGYGDVKCTYDEPFASLDDLFHLFLSDDTSSPSKEEFSYDYIDVIYRRDDSFKGRTQHANETNNEAYELENQPFISCGSWLSEYNLYSDDRGEDYNNGHGNDVENTQNIYQSEEWRDSYYKDMGKHLACNYNFWDGHWSKFGHRNDDCNEYGRQELEPTHSYHQDEMNFCKGNFGYWPCLFQRMPYKV